MEYIYLFIFCYLTLWVFFIYGCFNIKNNLNRLRQSPIHIV